MHVSEDSAPTDVEYVPATQGRHTAAVVAPVTDACLPARQLAQAPSPCTVLYLPATQFTHVPPTVVNPASQVHEG